MSLNCYVLLRAFLPSEVMLRGILNNYISDNVILMFLQFKYTLFVNFITFNRHLLLYSYNYCYTFLVAKYVDIPFVAI